MTNQVAQGCKNPPVSSPEYEQFETVDDAKQYHGMEFAQIILYRSS